MYDLTATPTWNNFHAFSYTNADEFAAAGFMIKSTTPRFINYNESIYVGYRFYETAAAEGVIDYATTVQYPFGYGLSYTRFSQTMSDLTVDGEGNISLDVTVTNTGSVAGKDVVEVYYNPPYTNGGIEKSTANLIAFDKTEMLEPGASETITITFKAEDMASYDADVNKAYVLEAGDYIISINSDSHTVIDSRTYNVPSTIVYGEGNARSTDATVATNQFDFADGGVTYLSRADGFANYAEATAAPASYEMSDELKASFINNGNYDPNEYNNADDVMLTTGVSNGLQLVDMRGVDYDDAQWDIFLDQLTINDMDTLIALGGYQTAAVPSIGKVQTYDCDGPASINNNFTGVGSVGFPSAVMIASTWNPDLASEFGRSIGKMADEMNTTGWYAPAMNNHRSAFAGRNFEYYSEDGVLSGKMAAKAIQGAEEFGVYAYMKHFALNDQEANRCDMLCTWSDEQSIREIYLKPFEISVKEGGCDAVMSSFNYIGHKWAGACDELLNKVLRDEWGFVGMVLTGYFGVYGYMDADQAIRNGTDFCLVNYDKMNFWNNFAAKHPAAAKWVREGGLFVIVSNLITVFKYLMLQFLPAAFAGLGDASFGWPGIPLTLFGETFEWNILGYDQAHGGLAYFCAYMVAMVIGECINFPIQRNFVFRSHGKLGPQIAWYLVAFCIITCIVNSINCIWVAVAGLLVPDFIYNIGTTVLNGGISMVVFFFVNKIILPSSEGEAKKAA